MSRFVSALMVLLIAGCGFHLRGTVGGELRMDSLYIQAPAASEISEVLAARLKSLGTEITATGSSATYRLELSGERVSRRSTATTADAGVAEFEVRLAVDLELQSAAGEILISRTTEFAEQSYDFDPDQLESSEGEEDELLRAMRRDVAGRILRRLQAATATET